MQHIFIVGAKSLGAYGGYETFVYKLTETHAGNPNLKYHVICKANGDGCMDERKLEGVTRINENEFTFHNAHCVKLHVPNWLGSGVAIYYDRKALDWCCDYIERNRIPHPVVYILACRIGPFITKYQKRIHALGGKLYLNPDGHEWKRSKWPLPIREYWKLSEATMVKHADLVICDSVNIERYIHECYDGKGFHGASPKTTFIAYGADLKQSALADDDPHFQDWLREKGLRPHEYYLVVGRFVPENNYVTMIQEFMRTNSPHAFALLTNANEDQLKKLQKKLNYEGDGRIKFVGTVYNPELLKKIRECAYANFHGHEVGGTNPSLLEALGATKLNLLLDVGFNREVAEDAALYWTKEPGSLSALIDRADAMPPEEIAAYGVKARRRVADAYSWPHIAALYERAFLGATT